MRDAKITDAGYAGCSYGQCRGKLGEIIYTIHVDTGREFEVSFAGTVWRGVPDPITDRHLIVLRLPVGFVDQDGIWCLSDAARTRMGIGRPRWPRGDARYDQRYREGAPAQQYRTHDAPRVYIALDAGEGEAGMSQIVRQQFKPGEIEDPIAEHRDLPNFRAQSLLPASVECPECSNVCRVAIAAAS